MARELWDACDREGNLLGFDLVRGEPMPQGAWHLVVEILALTPDGRVLVTRRHPDKSWGGYWEYTGGAVVKGETPLAAAQRELREETGIDLPEAGLRPVYVDPRPGIDGLNSIYHCFLAVFDPAEQTLRLQEGETVDCRLLPWPAFLEFVETGEIVTPIRRRLRDHREELEGLIENLLKK